jgi:hypothetical protein
MTSLVNKNIIIDFQQFFRRWAILLITLMIVTALSVKAITHDEPEIKYEYRILSWCNTKLQDNRLECIKKAPNEPKTAPVSRVSNEKVRMVDFEEYIQKCDWNTKIAKAVMMAESRGYIYAYNGDNNNGSNDTGLFQINSIHKQTDLYNWKHNVDIACGLYTDSKRIHRNGWIPWVAYNNGSYREYL